MVFTPLAYRHLFSEDRVLEWDWKGLGAFCADEWWVEWSGWTVLASGVADFLPQVLRKLSTHVGPFIFATDVVFTGRRSRDLRRWYATLQNNRQLEHGLSSTQVSHEEFGGVTYAVHLMSHCNIAHSVFRPYLVLHRTLEHVLNSATCTYGVEVSAPMVLHPPHPRRPMVEDGVLRVEGLLDVVAPRYK